MTTVVLLCDPPREGLVLPELVETSPLSAAEAADLYAAMLGDVAVAVEASGGELLVNYRPEESLPPEHRTDDADGADGAGETGEPTATSAEAEVRAVVRPVLEDPDAARFEVQVGDTLAGRIGNTVTHLLEREAVGTAAVVDPSAAFLTRQAIDSAAMKLRSSGVVLGPAPRGRVYYAGFAEPIDFADALATPPVGTLTDRGRDADLAVDFLPMAPVVETGADLTDALALLRARRRADRIVPERTADWFEASDLRLEDDEDGPTVVR